MKRNKETGKVKVFLQTFYFFICPLKIICDRYAIKIFEIKIYLDLKIFEAIDYIESVSKKKPEKERILEYMPRSNVELQEQILQMILENPEEESILENRGDDLNQCLYLKESVASYTKKREKE